MSIGRGLRWIVGGIAVAIGLAAPLRAPATEGDTLGTPTTITLNGPVFHVQGVDVDADFIYVSSVDKLHHRGFLHKFTRAGALVRTVNLSEGARYHAGGISLDGNSLWVPLAEYQSSGSTRILQLDKATLAPLSSFMVKDHIGAITPGAGHLYGANWGAKRFYIWDRAGHRLGRARNAMHVSYQDLKSVDGSLVASGTGLNDSGSIDWLDPQTLRPRVRLHVGRFRKHLAWSQEGMTIFRNHLYLLPADGLGIGTQLYVFDLTPTEVCGQLVEIPCATAAKPEPPAAPQLAAVSPGG